MIVQGFGNVGSHTAVILSKLGVSTIAVGDHTGYLFNPEGFNAHKLQDHVEAHGSIAGYPGGKPITREEFFAHEGRHLRPVRAREPDRRERGEGARRQARRRGRQRPAQPGGRARPARPGHRHPPGRARELGRRHRQLLRVGAEQALREVDARKRSTRASRRR